MVPFNGGITHQTGFTKPRTNGGNSNTVILESLSQLNSEVRIHQFRITVRWISVTNDFESFLAIQIIEVYFSGLVQRRRDDDNTENIKVETI